MTDNDRVIIEQLIREARAANAESFARRLEAIVERWMEMHAEELKRGN